MTNKPKAFSTTADQGGFNIQSTNTFFTNGSEDPWQWATQTYTRSNYTQTARTSECDSCGHCAELYTPTPNDPANLTETRTMIATWLDGILTNTTSSKVSKSESMFNLPSGNKDFLQ